MVSSSAFRSLSGMSPEAAERIYFWASLTLLVLTFVAFVASALVFASGRAKD